MKAARASNQPDFLAALIRTAYLPVEIPPVVTTRYYADFCKAQHNYLKPQLKNLLKHSTNYETFTAPATRSGRRNFALVHPLAQLSLSLLITQHRSRIKRIISHADSSLYRTNEDMARSRAFSGLDFQNWPIATAKICTQCEFLMKADISRFFYTAYTHSIPWTIIGKEKVKNWLLHDKKRLMNHWSNDLDQALQSCQSRETFGIPVGPDTSRIIAEILLAGVEGDEDYASAVRGRPAARLLDDFVVGFDNEDAARGALVALRNALWKFNLQLNEEKTSIIRSRLHFREKWKIEIDSITISGNDEEKQDRDIYRLIDLALQLCAEHRTSAPAHWACVRLSQIRIISGNFRTILDVMIRLGRDFPSCTNHVAAFLINNQPRCNDSYSRTKIGKWVKDTLRKYIRHSHEFEIAWCLLVSGVFRIRIEENDIVPFKPIPNSVIFAILGMLRERGLLAVPLSKWEWRAVFKRDGVYGGIGYRSMNQLGGTGQATEDLYLRWPMILFLRKCWKLR